MSVDKDEPPFSVDALERVIDIVRPVVSPEDEAEIKLQQAKAIGRLVRAMESLPEYIRGMANDMVEGFVAAYKEYSEDGPGTSIPSEQRHFHFEDKNHLDLYLEVVVKLGLYADYEAAASDLVTISDTAAFVAHSTPPEKVALSGTIVRAPVEDCLNMGVKITRHLRTDEAAAGSTYAISLEPCVLPPATELR